MLHRARQLKDALDDFLDHEHARMMRNSRASHAEEGVEKRITNAIFSSRLGADDWAIVNEILDMLKPIKHLTKRMEGRPSEHTAYGIADVYDSLALILGQLETLKQQYAESPHGMAFWSAIESA